MRKPFVTSMESSAGKTPADLKEFWEHYIRKMDIYCTNMEMNLEQLAVKTTEDFRLVDISLVKLALIEHRVTAIVDQLQRIRKDSWYNSSLIESSQAYLPPCPNASDKNED